MIIVYNWKSKVVGASAYDVDLTGTDIDNRGVVLLTLNKKREVIRIEDYYDTAKLAAPAGYTLSRPAAAPAPEPGAAPAEVPEGDPPAETKPD